MNRNFCAEAWQSEIHPDDIVLSHPLETQYAGIEITVPSEMSVNTYVKGAFENLMIAGGLLGMISSEKVNQ